MPLLLWAVPRAAFPLEAPSQWAQQELCVPWECAVALLLCSLGHSALEERATDLSALCHWGAAAEQEHSCCMVWYQNLWF